MESQQHFQELLNWAKSDSRNIINAVVAQFPDVGYGLKCTKSIKKNDIVLSIHRNFFLSLETCFNDKFMKEKVYPKGKSLNLLQKFIFFLWKEISREKESKYYHYLQSLPKDLSNLILWPKESIEALERPDLVSYALEKQKTVENEYEALSKFIIDQGLNKIVKPLTLADYKWLHSVIESRAISLPSKYDINSQVGALIPVYDFANHDFLYEDEKELEEKLEELTVSDTKSKENKIRRKLINQQEYFYFDSMKGFYMLKASQDYNEGDQVFIMYSGKANFHFIDYYGFLPRNNPNNNVTYKIPLKEEERLKYFTSCFNGEIKKKFAICHYLLPQIVFSTKPPGYIEGLEMRKKQILALVDTLEVEVAEENLDMSWQTKVFLKIFSLPNEVCEKFVKEKKKKHEQDEDEEEFEEFDDEEEKSEEEESNTKKESIQDLMNEEYFYDEYHRKNYDEMIHKVGKQIKEDLYGKQTKENIQSKETKSFHEEIAKEFVKKELEILEGFIRNIL